MNGSLTNLKILPSPSEKNLPLKGICFHQMLNISVNFEFCFMKKLWDLAHEKLVNILGGHHVGTNIHGWQPYLKIAIYVLKSANGGLLCRPLYVFLKKQYKWKPTLVTILMVLVTIFSLVVFSVCRLHHYHHHSNKNLKCIVFRAQKKFLPAGNWEVNSH